MATEGVAMGQAVAVRTDYTAGEVRRLAKRAKDAAQARRRACDLIMRLHEEFGVSVSDDTIYRALKDLGFSHVSARPKAYKQAPEAIDAFKKTSPNAWRKSERGSHRTHR